MQQENLIHTKAQQSNDIMYSLEEKLGEFRGNLNWLTPVSFMLSCSFNDFQRKKNVVNMFGSICHAAEVVEESDLYKQE